MCSGNAIIIDLCYNLGEVSVHQDARVVGFGYTYIAVIMNDRYSREIRVRSILQPTCSSYFYASLL